MNDNDDDNINDNDNNNNIFKTNDLISQSAVSRQLSAISNQQSAIEFSSQCLTSSPLSRHGRRECREYYFARELIVSQFKHG